MICLFAIMIWFEQPLGWQATSTFPSWWKCGGEGEGARCGTDVGMRPSGVWRCYTTESVCPRHTGCIYYPLKITRYCGDVSEARPTPIYQPVRRAASHRHLDPPFTNWMKNGHGRHLACLHGLVHGKTNVW